MNVGFLSSKNFYNCIHKVYILVTKVAKKAKKYTVTLQKREELLTQSSQSNLHQQSLFTHKEKQKVFLELRTLLTNKLI